jgi:hypothetical protein
MNWLDANADGLALLLWVGAAFLAFVLVAIAVEWWQGRDMRRRERQRQALRRYCDLILDHSWQGPKA